MMLDYFTELLAIHYFIASGIAINCELSEGDDLDVVRVSIKRQSLSQTQIAETSVVSSRIFRRR